MINDLHGQDYAKNKVCNNNIYATSMLYADDCFYNNQYFYISFGPVHSSLFLKSRQLFPSQLQYNAFINQEGGGERLYLSSSCVNKFIIKVYSRYFPGCHQLVLLCLYRQHLGHKSSANLWRDFSLSPACNEIYLAITIEELRHICSL